MLEYGLTLTRRDYAVDESWAMTCTAMPEGKMFFVNREKRTALQATWHEHEGLLLNGIPGVYDSNLTLMDGWFVQSDFTQEDFFGGMTQIADISVGTDFSRVYMLLFNGVPRNGDDVLTSLYDARIACLDVYSGASSVLRTYSYLPCWNMQDVSGYGETTSMELARQALKEFGLGTHSEYIAFLSECSTILSYMNRLYVCVPVFFAPSFMEMSVLYVFKESTFELIGIGIVGEISFWGQQGFVRPLKTNMCVIDDQLVFRNMRMGSASRLWHRDQEFFSTYVGYPNSYPNPAHLFLTEEEVGHYKQPYTVGYLPFDSLHEQIKDTDITRPAILEYKDWFNAQAIGNKDFSSITVDQNMSWMYCAAGSEILEFKLDLLLVELMIGNRWVSVSDITYPYLMPSGSNVPIRFRNGAEYTKLINISFEPDPDGAYVITPSSIPEMAPQSEVTGTIAFLPPSENMISKKLKYSYTPYN